MFPLELTGRYNGTNQLILCPTDPPRMSPATATVTPVSRGKVVRLDYTWDDDGPQEGTLLVGAQDGRDGVLAVWTDSWHMGQKLMVCSGEIDATSLRVLGTYTAAGAGAPPGPDWGWRIVITRSEAGSFVLQMFNIAPGDNGRADGEGDLAVDTHFHPVSTS